MDGDLCENIMRVFIDLTLAERGFIMLRNKESGEMKPIILLEFPEDEILGQLSTAKIIQEIVQEVVEGGLPLLTNNALPDYRWMSKEDTVALAKLKLRVIIAVPLKVGNSIIGVVYVDKRISVGVFNQETDYQLVQSLADAVAPLLLNSSNSRLHWRLG